MATILVLTMSLINSVVIVSASSVTAQTQQGTYIGRQTTYNGNNINYWYGISYAQQPIGNLRWMPPQELATSNNITTAYIPTFCPQTEQLSFSTTEACLTLDVYAPENANNLPVYVWIHGGSFTTGASADYNAIPLVSTSVSNAVPIVVVSINYRLGFLGFLADQQLYDEQSGINNKSTTGNYGILDQIMALNWIKNNINGFGGNPQKITIGGESAGATSVNILLTSLLIADGSFQGAIIQSGGMWSDPVTPLQTAISNSGSVLRAAVNCTTVECLRNTSVHEILAVQTGLSSQNLFGIAAFPVIDNYVLNDTIDHNYANGYFQKVSILIGSNTNETTLFTCSLFNYTATDSQVQLFFRLVYNTTIINEIPTVYDPISTYDNPLDYLNVVYSDSWQHCGSRRIAWKFSSYGLSSYLYTYNHILGPTPACFGVAHAAELSMLFPSIARALYPNYTLTVSEQQLSTNMMLYWANFIYKSNPNYNGNSVNWNAYTGSADNDFVLDVNLQMRDHYYNETCSGLWDQYVFTINATTTSFAMKCNCELYVFFLFLFISFV